MTKQYAETIMSVLHSIPVRPGWFPKIEDIAARLAIPKYKVSNLLKQLVEIGYLKKKGENWYDFVEKEDKLVLLDRLITETKNMSDEEFAEQEKQLGVDKINYNPNDYIGAATEENKQEFVEVAVGEYQPKNLEDKINDALLGNKVAIPIKQDRSFSIIRYVMAFLGVLSMIISIYYTFIWANDNLNSVLAVILSSLIVLFSTSAFETMIYIIKSKMGIFKWFISLFFLLLWIIVNSFSILSTAAGQYSLFFAKEQSKIDSITIESTEYNDLIVNEKELIDEKNILLEQEKPLLFIISSMKNMDQFFSEDKRSKESVIFYDAQIRINTINKDIENIDKQLIVVRNKKVELFNKNIKPKIELKSIPDFYTLFGRIISLDKSYTQFVFSLFPSVFLDIMSPICLAIFLFLKKKE
jgi:hypothetical protein